ncbi:PREDICTED: uncharacterized protein LOC108781767 [Cyphomyrmex costatus]|uniref:uncharacterized protein LOC108781767 n=1 Tax=Cyphomyrmex costatus TaxID=456900 RepID=UPI000852325F|nr:PREDICTED: uncharacterized protein LOC108781767 [Cyphomyrmex costatus]
MLATQFYPIGARQVFPCFDDPSFKATFNISIKHFAHYMALSNMPVRNTNRASLTMKWTHFHQTPVMSTYLLVIMLSDFPRTSVKEINFRYPRSQSELDTEFAQRVIQDISLHFESEWLCFQKLPKVDHVVLPNFLRNGVEYWGLIFYRESSILYNKELYSVGHKVNIARLIAQKIAYQWYGNLVSPLWWSDAWLYEGLTTLLATDAINKVDFSHYSFKVIKNYLLNRVEVIEVMNRWIYSSKYRPVLKTTKSDSRLVISVEDTYLRNETKLWIPVTLVTLQHDFEMYRDPDVIWIRPTNDNIESYTNYVIVNNFHWIILNVEQAESNDFLGTIKYVLIRLLRKIGFQENIVDDDLTKSMRQEAARWACTFNIMHCIRNAYSMLKYHLEHLDSHKISPWWKKWLYCNGLSFSDFNDEDWLLMLKESNDTAIMKYVSCSRSTYAMYNYINLTNNASENCNSGNQCKDANMLAKKRVNRFLYIVAKNSKEDVIFDYIKENYDNIKPREVSTVATFVIMINHMYSSTKLYKVNYVRELMQNLIVRHTETEKFVIDTPHVLLDHEVLLEEVK